MNNAEKTVLWMFFTIAILVIILAFVYATPYDRITSGKTFIIENASYKCTKINELIAE